MKKYLLAIMVLSGLLAFCAQANALSIIAGTTATVASGLTPGYDTHNQSAIDAIIAGLNLGAVELYKQDEGGSEEGSLAGSYETVFNDNFSGATITHTPGSSIIGNPQYLLVKDGNHSPFWYLFDLSSLGWDGMESLELSNFWPDGGAISHVTLYGTSAPVPEPGTLLLLGGGLFGMAIFGKRRMKA